MQVRFFFKKKREGELNYVSVASVCSSVTCSVSHYYCIREETDKLATEAVLNVWVHTQVVGYSLTLWQSCNGSHCTYIKRWSRE